MTPSFRLWRSSVTVEELTATVARYLGEERTRASFESFAATHAHQPASRTPRPTSSCCATPSIMLASAIGARLVAAGAVAAAAQAHGLDQGGAQAARRRQRGDPLQPRNPADRARSCAPGHRRVRQGPAAGLLEPAVRRNPRPAAGADPRRRRRSTRSCATTPSSGALGPAAIETLVRERLAHYVSGSEPFLERFAERGLVIEVRANRMPDGGIVTTVTDITAERRSGRSAGARQRDAGTARARAHRGADAAQRRARPRQGRGRGGQCFQDALPRRRQPRHPAAAQRRAALRHQPDRAPGATARTRGSIGNVDASLEAVEEILGALLDISRLDTGAMRPEFVSFRIDELLRQLEVEFAPLAREKGLELDIRAAARSRCAPTAGCCGGCCRTSSPTRSSTRRTAACWSAAGRSGGKLRIDVYDTGLGIPAVEADA